jgi:hypothetical protein
MRQRDVIAIADSSFGGVGRDHAVVVMRLDQTLGPVASRCLRIKLYVDENFP